MVIFPAIDIYKGKCVRLRQGHFDRQTVYSDSPVDVARSFRDAGFSSLHVVDLEGAKTGRITNWDSLESVLQIPGVAAQVGGGVRSDSDIERLLELGAKRVIIGSVAIAKPALVEKWFQEFGAPRIAIAIDVKNGTLASNGWLESTDLSPKGFIASEMQVGATAFICTDISRDGMLQGPNVQFYKEIRQSFQSIEVIASGGVSSINDIHALEDVGVSGVVVGKALYEGKLALTELISLNK